MKTPLFLSEADQQRLHSILKHLAPSPWPNAEQAEALRKLLSRSGKPHAVEDLNDHIGFLDEVFLVSPTDPRDTYDFRIVMPADSDPDEDRLSVLLPVALAVLGRRTGEIVSWECPRGIREMKVSSVVKSTEVTV